MKKKIIITTAVLLTLVIIATPLMVFMTKEKLPDLFLCDTVSDLQKAGISYSKGENGSLQVEFLSLFGEDGYGEMIKDGEENLVSINYTARLFQGEIHHEHEGACDHGEIPQDDALKRIDSLHQQVADYIGCPKGSVPMLIQFMPEDLMEQRPDDDFQALINGYIQYEYSYKNVKNELWILRVYSPYDGELNFSVMRVINASDYKNYIPQYDYGTQNYLIQ